MNNKFLFEGRLSDNLQERVNANNVKYSYLSLCQNVKNKVTKNYEPIWINNIYVPQKTLQSLAEDCLKGDSVLIEGFFSNRTVQEKSEMQLICTKITKTLRSDKLDNSFLDNKSSMKSFELPVF